MTQVHQECKDSFETKRISLSGFEVQGLFLKVRGLIIVKKKHLT